MDPISAFKTGAAAVSLVSALAKLAKEIGTRKDSESGQPVLKELMGRLQIEAVRLSGSLEHRLRSLVERVHEYGLNPATSLNDQIKDLSWYNVVTRFRLKSFRDECNAIYQQLTSFLDDATALLLCQGEVQLASSAFAASLDTKRQLDELFLKPDLPLGMLLKGMLAAAGRASADLRA
jgi:hypothetical protein